MSENKVEEIQEELLEGNEEGIEEKQNEGEVAQSPTPIEEKARAMGWRPLEDFDGDEEDFIDAQEFVRRKPLFEKIDSVGRELKETRKALRALQAHHERVKEMEYQNALKTLRAEKKLALEEGDTELLLDIDDRITDLKVQQSNQVREEAVQKEPHPGFIAWTKQNSWYVEDPELKIMADQIGASYAALNPDTNPNDILDYVSKRIKKLNPDKFSNPNKKRPSAVEGSSSNKSTGKQASELDDIELTPEEKKAMNTFTRQGILTKEEYLADIKALRGR